MFVWGCTLHRCARLFFTLVPVHVRTSYRKQLCTSVHFSGSATVSYLQFRLYLSDIQSIHVLYDNLSVAAQIYTPYCS